MADPVPARALERRFRERAEAGRATLVGYLVCGDPDLETTGLVVAAVAAAGLDVLELGIPYGDPLADGPTIAAAGQRALRAGASLEGALELVAGLRPPIPIVLFSYFNPILQFGVARFAARARAAGVSGVIVPDLTLEEMDGVRGPVQDQGLAYPLLVAPTTEPDRAGQIARASDGFLYVVSRMGVTGESRGPDLDWLRGQVERLRGLSPVPIAVGFGISSPEQVAEVAGFSDGVIVGSALVGSYAGARGEAAARLAGEYVGSLVPALPGQPRGR